jgi:hypothetical protein
MVYSRVMVRSGMMKSSSYGGGRSIGIGNAVVDREVIVQKGYRCRLRSGL